MCVFAVEKEGGREGERQRQSESERERERETARERARRPADLNVGLEGPHVAREETQWVCSTVHLLSSY